MKFTGKERDAETGLDYFESRYYSSAQGRFTSPDEFKGGFLDALNRTPVFQPGPLPYADITDPQTLNKYVYVRNNPLRYVDPHGHDIVFANEKLEARYDEIADQSPTFATELAEDRKHTPGFLVKVEERGVRQNDEKSSGDATVVQAPNGSVFVTVYVDSVRTSDSTIAHEQGHVNDARTNTKQLMEDGQRTKRNKGGPGQQAHNDRPEEKRADRFRDKVVNEQKQYQQRQREQRREEKRKKKEDQ